MKTKKKVDKSEKKERVESRQTKKSAGSRRSKSRSPLPEPVKEEKVKGSKKSIKKKAKTIENVRASKESISELKSSKEVIV